MAHGSSQHCVLLVYSIFCFEWVTDMIPDDSEIKRKRTIFFQFCPIRSRNQKWIIISDNCVCARLCVREMINEGMVHWGSDGQGPEGSDFAVTSSHWTFNSSACQTHTHAPNPHTHTLSRRTFGDKWNVKYIKILFQGQVSGLYISSHKSSSQFWGGGDGGRQQRRKLGRPAK